jgi:uncharacterized membrane protein
MENITGQIYLDKVTIIAHMTLLNQVSRKDKKKEEDLLTIMITKMMIFLVLYACYFCYLLQATIGVEIICLLFLLFITGNYWCRDCMFVIFVIYYRQLLAIIAHMTLLNQVSRKDKKKEEDLLTIMITKMMIFLVSLQNILGIQKCMEWQNLNK